MNPTTQRPAEAATGRACAHCGATVPESSRHAIMRPPRAQPYPLHASCLVKLVTMKHGQAPDARSPERFAAAAAQALALTVELVTPGATPVVADAPEPEAILP